MRIAEIFGPTIQGEGPTQGRNATFVRTSGCDLKCSWCDTPYTWDWSRFDRKAEQVAMLPTEVAEEVARRASPMLVITGGEPLIQHGACQALTDEVLDRKWVREVWVETNARHSPIDRAMHVCSPKLANAGDPDAIRWDPLTEHAERGSHLKMVVTTPADIAQVVEVADRAGFPSHRVWVMPEGRSSLAVIDGLRSIVEDVIAEGYNVSSRLHVLCWEDERGR